MLKEKERERKTKILKVCSLEINKREKVYNSKPDDKVFFYLFNSLILYSLILSEYFLYSINTKIQLQQLKKI
mgnify:CR=1 FL=1